MCPRCRTRFVSRNLWHSCGHFTLRGFLKGKPKRGIELFRYFLHHFSLSDESEIDSEFRTVMKMAYAVGERKHLNS